MVVTFNNAEFAAGQASTGLYVSGTFTGTGLLSGATPVTLNGTIGNPGSVVSVDINATGLAAVGAQGRYLGYSQVTGAPSYNYYFAVSGGGLPTPLTMAVTGAVLPALNVATPVLTANVSAPAGPLTPCFVTGTQILTTRGEVSVEDLQVGDIVQTAGGKEVPVEWIGHHDVRCDHSFEPTAAWPVRIAAHAFGPMKPNRDLFVSPGHALSVPFMHEDGILIPASALVNGGTIAQVKVNTVTYWHVKLATHDILLANGLPAESYIKVDDHASFEPEKGHIASEHTTKTLANYCRPFFSSGPYVDAVRLALQHKAIALGWTLDSACKASMHILADGRVITPAVDGQKARFILPADAKDVWLVSDTWVPAHVNYAPDTRTLGVRLEAISVSDGLSLHREISLEDPLLCSGFHQAEQNGAARWTSGKARLPAQLWDGCRDIAILQLGFAATPIPRWTPPAEFSEGSAIDVPEIAPPRRPVAVGY